MGALEQEIQPLFACKNLNATSEENQVNTLVYCMGDEAEDVLKGLTLTTDERKMYTDVRAGFDGFFVPKKNVIYERAKFNQRVQLPEETVDSFITALYRLAEHCKYGQLQNKVSGWAEKCLVVRKTTARQRLNP